MLLVLGSELVGDDEMGKHVMCWINGVAVITEDGVGYDRRFCTMGTGAINVDD